MSHASTQFHIVSDVETMQIGPSSRERFTVAEEGRDGSDNRWIAVAREIVDRHTGEWDRSAVVRIPERLVRNLAECLAWTADQFDQAAPPST